MDVFSYLSEHLEIVVIIVGLIYIILSAAFINWLIMLSKKHRSMERDIILKKSFSSKEPHCVLVLYITELLLYAVIITVFTMFSDKVNFLLYVLLLLLLVTAVINDLIQILSHWKKKIEVCGLQITYMDGFGRQHIFYANKIKKVTFGRRIKRSNDGSSAVKFYYHDGRWRKVNMYLYWEPFLQLRQWCRFNKLI